MSYLILSKLSHMLFSSFLWVLQTLRGAKIKRNPTRNVLESYVVANRMDNESHQLGSFGDLDLREKSLESGIFLSPECIFQFNKASFINNKWSLLIFLIVMAVFLPKFLRIGKKYFQFILKILFKLKIFLVHLLCE